MMYIDLLPVDGIYRGITRYFRFPRKAKYRLFESIYEQYLAWIAKQDDSYHQDVAKMLVEFCRRLNQIENKYEVICFSDVQSEFHTNDDFLGFDVLGEYRCSALEEGNQIESYFSGKLNANGLFANLEDAQEFCGYWNGLIEAQRSPFEVEVDPRPFCVWVYRK